jgi:hypothetical protein
MVMTGGLEGLMALAGGPGRMAEAGAGGEAGPVSPRYWRDEWAVSGALGLRRHTPTHPLHCTALHCTALHCNSLVSSLDICTYQDSLQPTAALHCTALHYNAAAADCCTTH